MNKKLILDLILSASQPLKKNEIAAALDIRGADSRVKLKRILRELEDEGAVTRTHGGAYAPLGALPEVAVLEMAEIDLDGDLLARPVEWLAAAGKPPRIEVAPQKKGHPAMKIGDRALARLSRQEDDVYAAHIIRPLDDVQGRVMGLVRVGKNGAYLEPANKKSRSDFEIPLPDLGGARDGDLAIAQVQPSRGLKRKKVRVLEVLGRRDDPGSISLISMHEAGLRAEFPVAVLQETQGMNVPSLNAREDLRSIPLVTIDGADARDFDDAVFAEQTPDGFHLIVAIADVAHYVRFGSALDTEARLRGNSTYFPDRVVPMLPEALSNDLCSLRPDEDRACLAVHLWIDRKGELQRHKFVRGLMRSRARLIYEQVQAVYDEGNQNHPLLPLIKPLYEAFAVLDAARRRRGALELDLPERKVILDKNGRMIGVEPRQRVDAHRLIEEFMILANVAAALTLEQHKTPCVYRVHDKPSADKLDSAREFLASFGFSLPKGHMPLPGQLNMILKAAAQGQHGHLISQMILRCQSQAHYAPENIGHYGLALKRYAHFTSPIRRYADLLIHRALIRACGLGVGGLDLEEETRLEEICQSISACERTSMEAERGAIERFTAAFLSQSIGARFAGRISGVTRFGLFVSLNESGADGLVPMRSLPDDFYIHDEKAHALIGRRWGRVYQLGAPVLVRLQEADGVTGSTLLALDGHEDGATIPGVSPPSLSPFRGGKRGGGRERDGKQPHRGKKPGKSGKPGKKGGFKGKRRR